MNKKKSLEQSIEKTIAILSKTDPEDIDQFDNYRIILNKYVNEYKKLYSPDKIGLFKDGE